MSNPGLSSAPSGEFLLNVRKTAYKTGYEDGWKDAHVGIPHNTPNPYETTDQPEPDGVIHMEPGDNGNMPCCGQTTDELVPGIDALANDSHLVTCAPRDQWTDR